MLTKTNEELELLYAESEKLTAQAQDAVIASLKAIQALGLPKWKQYGILYNMILSNQSMTEKVVSAYTISLLEASTRK